MSLDRITAIKDLLNLAEKLIKEVKENKKIKDINELMKCLVFLKKALSRALEQLERGNSYFL